MADLYFPTLLDLRNRVRFYIDDSSTDSFSDPDINYAINDAQQFVANEIDQVDEQYRVNPTPSVIDLEVNTQFYDLPDDFWKMTRLQDQQSGLPIDFTDVNSQNDFYQSFPPLVNIYPFGGISAFILGGNSAGQGGGSIGFTPIPTDGTKSVQMWYVPIIQDMDDDSDVTALPRQFTDMLAIQAAIDCQIKDQSDTSQLEAKYAAYMNQLRRSARDRQQQQPKYVRRAGNSQGYSGYYI